MLADASRARPDPWPRHRAGGRHDLEVAGDSCMSTKPRLASVLLALCCLAAALGGCLPQAAPPLSKEERMAKEKAEMLLPFAKPHSFEPAGQGYKIVFPGRPKPPQF